MADTIHLTSKLDGFQFSALHAAPEGPRRGGVVVIQEIFGLDESVKADVARWATAGYEVIAPSMFDRQEMGFTAAHDPEGFQKGFGYMRANGFDNPMGDVAACVDKLSPHGPVFMVGYCYGGLITWMAAAKVEGLAAASSYYGGLSDHAALQPRCPVICHFGAKDAHIPAEATQAALKAVHPDLPVYVYAGSGHGFNNDTAPDRDPADAELARRRTHDLFTANGAL